LAVRSKARHLDENVPYLGLCYGSEFAISRYLSSRAQKRGFKQNPTKLVLELVCRDLQEVETFIIVT
jgi:hypothetical protein